MGEAKFCPNCGKPIPQGAKFCPYCGFNLASIEAQVAIPQTQSAARVAKARERPMGLTIIAVYMVILTLIGVIVGLYILLLGLIGQTLAKEMERSMASRGVIAMFPTPTMMAAFAASLGLFVIGFSTLYAISAYGLWNMRHWAWTLASGVLVADIIASIPTSTEPLIIIPGIIIIIINAAALAYLSKKDIKGLFETAQQS